jgi:hypothetical protein
VEESSGAVLEVQMCVWLGEANVSWRYYECSGKVCMCVWSEGEVWGLGTAAARQMRAQ